MQIYNEGFARLYNLKWAFFANSIFPYLYDFYMETPAGRAQKPVLDLCCGTGQLAVGFLEKGLKVTGLDLSEFMLAHAKQNAQRFIEAGQARFVQGDAAAFELDERFGLVVSTYDALNHLDTQAALKSCFACVAKVCEGTFIFDLNTALGLRQWNGVTIDDSDENALIITRGEVDEEGGRGWTRITGFMQQPNGLYERCDQTAFNTFFHLGQVQADLLATGWKKVHFARIKALQTPLSEPESDRRVFVVAQKE